MAERSDRILVAGGGHAGLLLANGLARIGLPTTVIDAAEPVLAAPEAFDGRALALMYGSRLAMEWLGVWPFVAPFTTPVRAVDVVDRATGERITYDAAEVGEHPFAYGIENLRLRSGLLAAALEQPTIELVGPAEIIGVRRRVDGVEVQLGDGRTLAGPLLIGADGRNSSVRQLSAIGTERRAYGQTALTFAVRHDRSGRERVREFLRPSGPLALLPIGPRLTSITWVDRPERANRLAAAGPERLARALRDEIGDILGDLEVAGAPMAYPLSSHRAVRFAGPHVALVGDAAHGIHPIHAQGFNLGVRDVATLVAIMADAANAGQRPGAGEQLARYDRQRRGDTAFTLALTDGLARLFSTDLVPAQVLRTLGLEALRQIPPLRRLAMRRGMGLIGGPGSGGTERTTGAWARS